MQKTAKDFVGDCGSVCEAEVTDRLESAVHDPQQSDGGRMADRYGTEGEPVCILYQPIEATKCLARLAGLSGVGTFTFAYLSGFAGGCVSV